MRQSIYIVFAGGDDLVIDRSPWDVVFRFAGHMRELFRKRFPELSLSAGMASVQTELPVKTAIEQAERFLDHAKGAAEGPRRRLGQVWNWNQHALILQQAKQLACGGVEANQMQARDGSIRCWNQSCARHGDRADPLATARLAYHVNRNYRRNTAARRWADGLLRHFDNVNQPDVCYLPSIVRHALTATRSRCRGVMP